MEIVAYERAHLGAILALAEGVAFSTLVEDPERAHRVLGGPGSVTLVALEGDEPVGFAHTITTAASRPTSAGCWSRPRASGGGSAAPWSTSRWRGPARSAWTC